MAQDVEGELDDIEAAEVFLLKLKPKPKKAVA
jgi:hypothetical protein